MRKPTGNEDGKAHTGAEGSDMRAPTAPTTVTPPTDDIFIALMGVTGSGKTTFISKCCPEAANDIGHSLNSQTTAVHNYSFMLNGRKINLIDTPGFDDTTRSDTDVLKDIALWLSLSYSYQVNIHGILYLHPISDSRMRGSAMRNLRIFKELCGEKSMTAVLLVTTMWDRAGNAGVEREVEIVSVDGFWGSMVRLGSTVHRHDGSMESAVRIISSIVSRQSLGTVLQIQSEMVDECKPLGQTAAGKELIRQFDKSRAGHEEELQKLRLEMGQAIARKDQEMVHALAAMKLETEARIQATTREREYLSRIEVEHLLMEKDVTIAQTKEELNREKRRRELEISRKDKQIQGRENIIEQTQSALKTATTEIAKLEFKLKEVKESDNLRQIQDLQASILALQEERERSKVREVELSLALDEEREEREQERAELQRSTDVQAIVQAVFANLGVTLPSIQHGTLPPYPGPPSSQGPSPHIGPDGHLTQSDKMEPRAQIDSSPISNPSSGNQSLNSISALNLRPRASVWTLTKNAWSRHMRPKTAANQRRITWICECGRELFADYDNTYFEAIDDLERLLRASNVVGATSESEASQPSASQRRITGSETSLGLTAGSSGGPGSPPRTDTTSFNNTPQVCVSQERRPIIPEQQRYLALCVNTGSDYKTLVELEMPINISDASLFKSVKDTYMKMRGLRGLYNFLMEPVDVHFVNFRLWHLKEGYVSIDDKPNCIPPPERMEYEYIPQPLVPPQPMPPKVLIHYLNHKDTEFVSKATVWAPRLPKRREVKIIQCPLATEGWGMHIVEAPNRHVIFWTIMTTVFGSIIASILWSTLQKDIQGGTGLGQLIIALPPVIMAAFLFRINAL